MTDFSGASPFFNAATYGDKLVDYIASHPDAIDFLKDGPDLAAHHIFRGVEKPDYRHYLLLASAYMNYVEFVYSARGDQDEVAKYTCMANLALRQARFYGANLPDDIKRGYQPVADVQADVPSVADTLSTKQPAFTLVGKPGLVA